MMITLTGFMGSGKTTVGKVLADFLGCPFMDLDDLIVKKAGKSIPEIFAQDGEPAFRELSGYISLELTQLEKELASRPIKVGFCSNEKRKAGFSWWSDA